MKIHHCHLLVYSSGRCRRQRDCSKAIPNQRWNLRRSCCWGWWYSHNSSNYWPRYKKRYGYIQAVLVETDEVKGILKSKSLVLLKPHQMVFKPRKRRSSCWKIFNYRTRYYCLARFFKTRLLFMSQLEKQKLSSNCCDAAPCQFEITD